jgi:hypothetical protein
LDALWQTIESSELAFVIGASAWFPLLESLHVLGLALFLGSLLMLDLRLAGLVARDQDPAGLAAGMMAWIWIGFALAVLTGVGMFVSRPSAYAANAAFQIKLALLLAAGANLLGYRVLGVLPRRLAGSLSLMLWGGIVLAGRWTGHLM